MFTSTTFVNNTSTVFFSMNNVCGALVVSSNFCDFTDVNFMTHVQTYFSNTLTSYGYGSGFATQANHSIAYVIDMSFGCFTINSAVCGAANWSMDADYIAAGSLNGPPTLCSTGLQGEIIGASGIIVIVIMLVGVILTKGTGTNGFTGVFNKGNKGGDESKEALKILVYVAAGILIVGIILAVVQAGGPC